MLDRADSEDRDFTGKESKRFDEIKAELDTIETDIVARTREMEAEMSAAGFDAPHSGLPTARDRSYFGMFPNAQRSNCGFESFDVRFHPVRGLQHVLLREVHPSLDAQVTPLAECCQVPIGVIAFVHV
ncbi:MAG: hypothetical protein IID28_13390 [Planctomycetes bacterium]|nr:hypothetical protein [Planctomycetota bacterium]